MMQAFRQCELNIRFIASAGVAQQVPICIGGFGIALCLGKSIGTNSAFCKRNRSNAWGGSEFLQIRLRRRGLEAKRHGEIEVPQHTDSSCGISCRFVSASERQL